MPEDRVERRRRERELGRRLPRWYRVPSGLMSKNRQTRLIALAVDDVDWQRFRGVRLKNEPTAKKLELLLYWVETHRDGSTDHVVHDYSIEPPILLTAEERAQAQAENYLEALKRGGFIRWNPARWQYTILK